MTNIVALILATSVLVIIPGPNVALIVANSLRHGLWFGLITTMGTTTGVAMQLFLVVTGVAEVIDLAASALVWIRWAGVAYLVYLGIQTWQASAGDVGRLHGQSGKATFWRGLGFAIINPKTLLFNAAFLPQFVGDDAGTAAELFLLAGIFLGIVLLGDVLWSVFANSARCWLDRAGHLRNRVSGTFLVGAGLGLALSRRGTGG